MCGIGGILQWEGRIGDDSFRPEAIIQAMRHRGPDGDGVWLSPDRQVWLGHRRLAIIDLSEAGRQPMEYQEAGLQLTFNGEIYNFQSLRRDLETLGHAFRTRTDSEVILHAYQQWGTECVQRLRGMFAFAIWDTRKRRLFLARDRVGKKPLFYTQQRGRFVFASELQGLLADPSIPRTVDYHAIDGYLTLGYVPPPHTAYVGIRKLLPGHWMTVDLGAGEPVVRTERYWSLQYLPKLRTSEREACEALRDKMAEAVRLRMISDVPLGAFLSGGVDSSIVVGLMARESSRPVKTFSIGFEEASFNELAHAKRIAERWKTEHHEFVIRPDAAEILPMLVRHYGEPYADTSAMPTYYLSKMTRDSVTVALNGDGGDESFVGYARYKGNQLAELVRRFPGSGAVLKLFSGAIPASVPPNHPLQRIRRFLAAAHQPMVRRYSTWQGAFAAEERTTLYTGDLKQAVQEHGPCRFLDDLFEEHRNLEPAEAAMAVDVQSYLPYDLLVKVDIATMATSLEGRSPFLDHEVMEFAARLPLDLKLRGGNLKHLPKVAFQDLLPSENVNRSKMGFGVPVGEWMRTGLRDLVHDTLLSDRSLGRGYFQPAMLRRLVSEHEERRVDHTWHLWKLVMLELWQRDMVDARPGPASA